MEFPSFKQSIFTIVVVLLLAVGTFYFLLPQPVQVPSPDFGARVKVNPNPPGGNRVGPVELYPRNDRTPGAINTSINQGNISQNICAGSAWSTKSIRPPASYTTALKIKQLAAGYTYQGDTNTADYELDHLISLELGGNPTDPKNLWPEPYKTTVKGQIVGAKQKDSVENELHKEICSGKITLITAQNTIVNDWYLFYTNMPKSKTKTFGASVITDPDDE